MNVLPLVKLVLLLNRTRAWQKLLSNLWLQLHLLRRVHDLLRTIRLLLYILYGLDELLLSLLLGLDHIYQLLASILVHGYLLPGWQTQNLLNLLSLVNVHLCNFTISRV